MSDPLQYAYWQANAAAAASSAAQASGSVAGGGVVGSSPVGGQPQPQPQPPAMITLLPSSSSSSASASSAVASSPLALSGSQPVALAAPLSLQSSPTQPAPPSHARSHSMMPGGSPIAAAAPPQLIDLLSSPPTQEADYPSTSDGYTVLCEIGSGAFSTVYRGVVRSTGEEVAIKVIDLDQFNTSWEEIRREILIMSQLNHHNITKLKTAFVDGQDLWLVLNLATAGSCAAIMKELGLTRGIKDERAIATILKEVLQALAYFHKHGSIHRDVKAGNILVSGSGEVQLADFGVAGTLMEGGDRKKNRQTFTGTPCWMAPEVMEHTESEGYDEKADIWSFGITAMELGYGRAPYATYPPMKVMLLTLQEEPPTCAIYNDNSYEFSRHFHSLISKCLRRDPKKRPTARKLLEHKFFRAAADSRYLLDTLVRRLPPREIPSEPLQLRKRNEAGDSNCHNTLTRAPNPGAGVKLGSWVFDEEELDEFKRSEGEQQLDLLSHTLQHQHHLPHHHHHQAAASSADGADVAGVERVPQEVLEEDDEDDYEQEPSNAIASPKLQPSMPNPLANFGLLPVQPPTSSNNRTSTAQTAAVEPPDFFSDIAPPAVDALTDHLSSSAVFPASGRLSPSSAAMSPSGAPTPTLSSVQGKTRQFVVHEEEVTDTGADHESNSSSMRAPLSQSPRAQVQSNAAATSSVQAATVDLLADDFDLASLSTTGGSSSSKLQTERPLLDHATLAAADAFAATSSPASASAAAAAAADAGLDLLAAAPGSATLAYLAAMGDPAPVAAVPAPSPATSPSPRMSPLGGGGGLSPSSLSPSMGGLSGGVGGGSHARAASMLPGGGPSSPSLQSLSARRASIALSSLLPVAMLNQNQKAQGSGTGGAGHMRGPSMALGGGAAGGASLLSSNASLNEQPAADGEARQVGRFQVTLTETSQ